MLTSYNERRKMGEYVTKPELEEALVDTKMELLERAVHDLSWPEMAELVHLVWLETKRRNPVGVNFYQPAFEATMNALDEIAVAEALHPTSDCGPTKAMI